MNLYLDVAIIGQNPVMFEKLKWNLEDLRGAGHPHPINRDFYDLVAATGWGEELLILCTSWLYSPHGENRKNKSLFPSQDKAQSLL